MKNPLLISACLLVFCSCGALKRSTTSSAPAPSSTEAGKKSHSGDPKFLESISIKSAPSRSGKKVIDPLPGSEADPSIPPVSLEIMPGSQFKYAILLDIPVERITDLRLTDFLDSWYGTPYRLGGTGKSGIDCSAFVQTFLMTLYGISVPRTSRMQYNQCERIRKDELQEGDLVFFSTQRNKKVSHVGVYLANNKFVHASTSSGVMISDLSEPYFASRFTGAGRYGERGISKLAN